MTPRAVCVGDVMVDVLAQLPGELAHGSDTPAPITLHGGGSAANTAAWLAVAGVRTSFVGRIGADPLGRFALDELGSFGIDLHLSVDPVLATGACIVLVDATGERTMVPSTGANAALSAAFGAGARAAFTGAHVHLSAYALFGARAAADAALELAATAGTGLSVDAASAAPLRAFGPAAFLDWLPRCLLFANADEAGVLTGSRDPRAAVRALARRTGAAVVKCGDAGAVWSDGNVVLAERSPAATVVDSTGAGDAFAAGYLRASLSGGDPGACLHAGNALAARAIARVGARPPGQL